MFRGCTKANVQLRSLRLPPTASKTHRRDVPSNVSHSRCSSKARDCAPPRPLPPDSELVAVQPRVGEVQALPEACRHEGRHFCAESLACTPMVVAGRCWKLPTCAPNGLLLPGTSGSSSPDAHLVALGNVGSTCELWVKRLAEQLLL